MNFLAPWFLAGAALIAGPIIAHLIRRATRERIGFSATRFLDPSTPKLDRRSRVRHPWLLALRCLIVAVLAAGFARPFSSGPHPALSSVPQPRYVVAMLDESASMQRAGLWSDAISRVLSAAEKLGAADHFALLGVSSRATELVSFETWDRAKTGADRLALVRAALATRQPSAGPTYLDLGLETALDLLQTREDSAGVNAKKQLIVISDLTAGSRVSGLASREWPKNCEVVLERVGSKVRGNTALQWLGWSTDTTKGLSARVRVTRTKEGAAPGMRLRVRDGVTGTELKPSQALTVAPGDSQVVTVTLGETPASKAVRVDLEGDEEPFDNTLWAVPPQTRTLSLLYWGKHNATDTQHSRFYLERATSGWREPVVQLHAADEQQTPGLDAAAVAETRVFVITEPLKAPALDAVRARIADGAFALVLLNGATDLETAQSLAGESGWQEGKTERADALIGKVDFEHPLFSLFADPRFSDFTHIHFWQPRPFLLPASSKSAVVARFDDGSAAIVEAAVGRGRVVIWGGDWQPKAGQWVLSSKFVPWLQAFVERALGGPERPVMAEVGDARRLWRDGPAQWRETAAANAPWRDSEPEQPGVYDLRANGETRRVALQTAASESRLEPLPLETWDQLGVPLKADTAVQPGITPPKTLAKQAAGEAEAEQKLWRWLIVVAALLLAMESIVALRLARGQPASTTPEMANA